MIGSGEIAGKNFIGIIDHQMQFETEAPAS